jgi:hypothetical protein
MTSGSSGSLATVALWAFTEHTAITQRILHDIAVRRTRFSLTRFWGKNKASG